MKTSSFDETKNEAKRPTDFYLVLVTFQSSENDQSISAFKIKRDRIRSPKPTTKDQQQSIALLFRF
jgi:hypothetical protein